MSLSSPSCLISIAFLKEALLWSRDRHSCAGKNSRLFGCMKWQVFMIVMDPGGWSPCPQGYLVICGGWTNTGVGKGMFARLTHRSCNLQKDISNSMWHDEEMCCKIKLSIISWAVHLWHASSACSSLSKRTTAQPLLCAWPSRDTSAMWTSCTT